MRQTLDLLRPSPGLLSAGATLVASLVASPSVVAQPMAPSSTETSSAVASSAEGAPGLPDPLCEDGVIRDDGTVETGYGWVPSAVEGVYVQTFFQDELGSDRVAEVCVCWLRTRPDDVIDYEIVVYTDRPGGDGLPRLEPGFAVPVRAENVPEGITGRFYSTMIDLPVEGRFHVGVRWDPSVDQFFFLCADHTDNGSPAQGYFIDDRADDWGDVLDTNDSTFTNHEAMFVRIVAGPSTVEQVLAVPALSPPGLLAAVFLLVVFGVGRLRARPGSPRDRGRM